MSVPAIVVSQYGQSLPASSSTPLATTQKVDRSGLLYIRFSATQHGTLNAEFKNGSLTTGAQSVNWGAQPNILVPTGGAGTVIPLQGQLFANQHYSPWTPVPIFAGESAIFTFVGVTVGGGGTYSLHVGYLEELGK